MAQNFSDNLQANTPKQLDNRTGVFDGTPLKWRPFNDIAEFNASWPLIVRFATQMFWVKNPLDSNKADLYALRGDKTPYRVIGDIIADSLVSSGSYTWSIDNIKAYVVGSIVQPFKIPFDWTIEPVTTIDMTLGDLPSYGNNPRIEVWLTLTETTEMNYTGQGYVGQMIKEYTDGVLTQINFPDLALDDFSPSKKGYFLIAI